MHVSRASWALIAVALVTAGAPNKAATAAPSVVEISPPQPPSKDNAEIIDLLKQDKAGREHLSQLSPAQMTTLEKNEAIRLTRILELYKANALISAADYYGAAMILQHGTKPEDYLLGHELAVIAAIQGDKRAPWLVAVSEDRFLRSIGREQRFATQYWRDLKSDPNAKWEVAPLEDGVTDPVRKLMHCPLLDDAKARAKTMNGQK